MNFKSAKNKTIGFLFNISIAFLLITNVEPKVYADSVTWTQSEVQGSQIHSDFAVSIDGQYIVMANQNGYIYTSSDYGSTWTPRKNAKTRVWRRVAISADGRIISADAHYNRIVTSRDYGVTWEEQDETPEYSWGDITSSADGSVWLASGSPGVGSNWIYISSDSANTWSLSNAGTRGYEYVTASQNGHYLAATVYNSYIYTSSDYGATWSPQTASGTRKWDNLRMSQDGKYLVASVPGGNIYTSDDYGVTWNARTGAGSRTWNGLSISSDGSKIAVADETGRVYLSVNYGVDWVDREGLSGSVLVVPSDFNIFYQIKNDIISKSEDAGITWNTSNIDAPEAFWSDVCESDDGSVLVGVTILNGSIYVSTDHGNHWTKKIEPGLRNWYGVVCSADGSRIVAVANNSYIYTSSDYGATWVSQIGSGSRSWSSVASSPDGKYIAAGLSSGYIYTSSDYGVNWVEHTSSTSKGWPRIAISSDGKYILAGSNSYLYLSSDYGESWTARTDLGNGLWYGVDMSPDGKYLVAALDRYFVYTSDDYGINWARKDSLGLHYFGGIAISDDGKRLVASAVSTTRREDVAIYISKDAGDHWVKQLSLDESYFLSIDANRNLTKIAVVARSGPIYVGNATYTNDAPALIIDRIPDPNHDPMPVYSGIANPHLGYSTSVQYQIDGTSGSWIDCSFDVVNTDDANSFEEDFPPVGYSLSGDANWSKTSSTAQDGTYSAASGTITDSQSTSLRKSYTFEEDAVMNFYVKTDTESPTDQLFICVDDTCTYSYQGFEKAYFGALDWFPLELGVSEGTHDLEWKYLKDSNTTVGADKVWLDNISFRSATKFTCEVSSPLTNGVHSVYFRAEDSVGNSTQAGQEKRVNFTVDYDVVVAQTNNSTVISEDGLTDTIGLSLAIRPTNDVSLSISSPDSRVVITPSTLNFTVDNWDTPQDVSISINNNNQVDPQKRRIYLYFNLTSDDPNYDSTNEQRFRFTIKDHDYGDRIEESKSAEDYKLNLFSIANLLLTNFKKVTDTNTKNDEKEIYVTETSRNRPEVSFTLIDDEKNDVEIEKYEIQIQNTDEHGNRIERYKSWVDNIKHKTPEKSETIYKDGFKITYTGKPKNSVKVQPILNQLNDGTYYIRVKATDGADNSVTSDEVKFIIKPNLGNSATNNGTLQINTIGSIQYDPKYTFYYYSGDTLTLFGSGEANKEIILNIDGGEAARTSADASGSFVVKAPVSNGEHKIELIQNGNTIEFELRVDTTEESFPTGIKG